MRRRRDERQVLLLCLLTDLFIFWLALNLATLSRLHTLPQADFLLLQRDRIVCLGFFAISALLAGSYTASRVTDRFDSIYYVLGALGFTGLLVFATAMFLPLDVRVISRRELLLSLAVAAVLLAVWRLFATSLIVRVEAMHRRFFVLGSETEGRRVADDICRRPEVQAQARYVTLEELECEAAKVERSDDEAARFAPLTEDAIVIVSEKDRDALLPIVEVCERCCRRTFLYPSLHDTLLFQHHRLVAIAGVPLIEVGSQPGARPYHYLKRAVDLVAASVGILLALPLIVFAALAVKLTSPGPVFYTQERMGRDGHIFRLYKFRSMVQDAEARTGPVWATAKDSRVTPVGKFLRKHRIDEIPQLFNVLRGDMSLIGPRPERPHFHQEFSSKWPLFERRLAVRPGVTSLSHVLGSYSSEPDDRLRYDLIYISSVSLLTDLRILVATIRVVLGAKGAQ